MAGATQSPVRLELGQLLKLAGPVVLARLGIMGMGFTDTVVVGRYSAEQLGFHAMGMAPTSVVVTLVVGLLVGVQVMTARAVGEGRMHEAGAVLRRGLVYAFSIGGVATAALLIGEGLSLIDAGVRIAGGEGGWLGYLALHTHLAPAMRGLMRSEDIVYFLIIIALALTLAIRRIAAERERG